MRQQKPMSLQQLILALQIQRELIYENTIDEASCYWGPDGEAIRRVDLERLQSLENRIHPKIRERIK